MGLDSLALLTFDTKYHTPLTVVTTSCSAQNRLVRKPESGKETTQKMDLKKKQVKEIYQHNHENVMA